MLGLEILRLFPPTLQSLHAEGFRVAEICLLLAEVAESDAPSVGQVIQRCNKSCES